MCVCVCLFACVSGECDKCCQVVAKLPLNQHSIIISPLVLLHLMLWFRCPHVRIQMIRTVLVACSRSLSLTFYTHAPPLSAVAHTDTHTHTHTMKSAWFANTWSRYVYLFNFKRANRAFATSRLILISNLIS